MRSLSLMMLLVCAACVACAPTPRASAEPKATAPSGDTQARIRALIGDAACTQDAQCHTLALGKRACGGPQAYLPWSSAKTDSAALAALGQQFKEEREAAITASGEMSTCQFLPDPGAVCRAGTCQLNQTGPGGQSAI